MSNKVEICEILKYNPRKPIDIFPLPSGVHWHPRHLQWHYEAAVYYLEELMNAQDMIQRTFSTKPTDISHQMDFVRNFDYWCLFCTLSLLARVPLAPPFAIAKGVLLSYSKQQYFYSHSFPKLHEHIYIHDFWSQYQLQRAQETLPQPHDRFVLHSAKESIYSVCERACVHADVNYMLQCYSILEVTVSRAQYLTEFWASMLAPSSKRSSATPKWPFSAAKCSGVFLL